MAMSHSNPKCVTILIIGTLAFLRTCSLLATVRSGLVSLYSALTTCVRVRPSGPGFFKVCFVRSTMKDTSIPDSSHFSSSLHVVDEDKLTRLCVLALFAAGAQCLLSSSSFSLLSSFEADSSSIPPLTLGKLATPCRSLSEPSRFCEDRDHNASSLSALSSSLCMSSSVLILLFLSFSSRSIESLVDPIISDTSLCFSVETDCPIRSKTKSGCSVSSIAPPSGFGFVSIFSFHFLQAPSKAPSITSFHTSTRSCFFLFGCSLFTFSTVLSSPEYDSFKPLDLFCLVREQSASSTSPSFLSSGSTTPHIARSISLSKMQTDLVANEPNTWH
mmetsp:Transcript_27040/g.44622  ORF Transcript_27040/g.44622 Transcript_27040/m.44622 type:complete len:330 (-) Transcript_27040:503-1492(-)